MDFSNISGIDVKNLKQRDYILNNYNTHKFDENHILVTTDHSSWTVLDKQEYKLLRLGRVHEDKKLYQKLEKEGIILSEDNVQDVVETYRKSKSFLYQGPTLHIVTPTMRCNARCVYCHSRAKHVDEKDVDMDRETAKKIVDFIMKAPSDSHIIEFQGGDTLLNYDTTEFIIDYARDRAEEEGKRISFSLVTNLTLMNEDIIDSLKKREIKGLATSLDGPKDIHDKNRIYARDGRGTYEDTVHWINRINNEFSDDFNLNAMTTVTSHALGRGKDIVDEFVDLGFNGIWLRPLNNLGYAKDTWDQIGYTQKEFFNFWTNSLDYIMEVNRNGYKLHELMAIVFLYKIFDDYDPNYVDIMSPCGAGIGQLVYKYNGDIHTCDEGKIDEMFKLGNVYESKYTEIFDNETLISMVDISSKESYICNNCEWKPFCGVCPVATYKQQGSIVSKVCEDERTRMYSRMIKDIFKRIIYSEEDRKMLKKWKEEDKVYSK